MTPILTTRFSNNAAVFADILELYVPKGSLVADVTFANGAFWKEVNRNDYNVLASDISPQKRLTLRADATCLPYRGKFLSALILDPPFGSLSTTGRTDNLAAYYNCAPATGEERVRELYRKGIVEAARVLKLKGVLIVKCQDAVNSGIQQWFHIEVFNMAIEHGFLGLDLFVVARPKLTMIRHKAQKHAWKNHSYFWIFQKANRGQNAT